MKSFMKKAVVALAFVVGATSVPIGGVVHASAKPSYDDVYQIKNSDIKEYRNNGGQYSTSYLKYAFDGDPNTHWETRNPNSNNHKNQVIVQFKKTEDVGSVSYFPRVHGEANKGFPTSFTIYGTDSEDAFSNKTNWIKLHQGTANIASGELKIKFKYMARVKGIKFVFEEAHKGYAASTDFKFYKPDPETDEVNALFTDGTMSDVKDNVTEKSLKVLQEKVKDHPSAHLMDKVELALDIVGGKDVKSTVFAVEQRGNGEHHARRTLRTSSYGSNFLPTGIAAMKGQEVKVYVEVEDGKPVPQIVFAEQVGSWRNWKHVSNLKEGENILRAQRSGAIYLIYPYDEKTGGNPQVRIEGGHKYPLFKDNGNEAEFIAELKEYKDKQKKSPDKYVNIVELVSDYAILNSNLQSAEVYLREVDQRSPQKVIDHNKDRISKYFALAGLSETGEDKHSRNGARANMRLMQPFGLAYAAGDHTGFQQGAMNLIFRGDNYGWAIAHELGHHFDIMGGKIPETTNNMWSNYNAVLLNGEYDRVSDASYDVIFKKSSAHNHAQLDNKGSNGLAVWWQLYLYDQNYWAEYNKAIRNGVLDEFKLKNNENMVVASSYALGMDMTEFFVRHKFINEETASKLKLIQKQLGVKDKPSHIKPWYMHTKAVKSEVKTFTDSYVPEIVDIKKSGKNIELKLNINDSAKDALLGYEVIQDGNVIGFTKSNTFTTLGDDGKSHVYQVRAYDIKQQNVTGLSKPVVFDSTAPTIKVTDSTIIKAGTPVYASRHVSAKSIAGEELDVVRHGNVSSSVYGYYTLTFSATDHANKSVSKQVRFHTVAEVVYASELEPVIKVRGYNGLREDVAVDGGKIGLLLNGKEKEYERGLGAHANSTIEYQLNGAYDLFETFIGIDQAMRNSEHAKASFKILVDDVVKYESGVFTAKTEQEHIKLDIKGANKITLVTNSLGANTADHTIWADAKFAKINSDAVKVTDEIRIIGELKEAVKEALKGINVNDIGSVSFNLPVYNFKGNDEENIVYNKLMEKLNGKYDGIISILINNTSTKFTSMEELIENGVHISYTAKDSNTTYYTSGKEIRTVQKP